MPRHIVPQNLPNLYLREWRERFQLSQDELARRIGSSQFCISRWERPDEAHKRSPNLLGLAAAAEALGLTITDLFRHPDRPSIDKILQDQPREVVDKAVQVVRAMLH